MIRGWFLSAVFALILGSGMVISALAAWRKIMLVNLDAPVLLNDHDGCIDLSGDPGEMGDAHRITLSDTG